MCLYVFVFVYVCTFMYLQLYVCVNLQMLGRAIYISSRRHFTKESVTQMSDAGKTNINTKNSIAGKGSKKLKSSSTGIGHTDDTGETNINTTIFLVAKGPGKGEN